MRQCINKSYRAALITSENPELREVYGWFIFATSLCVKQKCFVKADLIELYVHGIYNEDKENFISSSLWNIRKRSLYIRSSRKSLTLILLLLCGDIESCSGPIRECPDLKKII